MHYTAPCLEQILLLDLWTFHPLAMSQANKSIHQLSNISGWHHEKSTALNFIHLTETLMSQVPLLKQRNATFTIKFLSQMYSILGPRASKYNPRIITKQRNCKVSAWRINNCPKSINWSNCKLLTFVWNNALNTKVEMKHEKLGEEEVGHAGHLRERTDNRVCVLLYTLPSSHYHLFGPII